MAADPLEVRLARLEGSYEQIDRRLGSIEDRLGRLESKVDAAVNRLDAKIDAAMTYLDSKISAMELSLRQEMRHDFGVLAARVYTILYGLILAILVPILIRVFFP